MFNFSRYLASNTIIPLRPKEWYVVVLPGPFFESSKDAKCLKESNWTLADMLNQLMSQDRYARLTWHRKSEFVDCSHVCPKTGFLPRWKPSENISHAILCWLFTSLPGHVWWGISHFRRLFGCIKMQWSSVSQRYPSVDQEGTLEVVEGQCFFTWSQFWYSQGRQPEPPETLHDFAWLLGFLSGTDLEIRKSKLRTRLCSPSLRGDVWLGDSLAELVTTVKLACIVDNFSKMIILLMVQKSCTVEIGTVVYATICNLFIAGGEGIIDPQYHESFKLYNYKPVLLELSRGINLVNYQWQDLISSLAKDLCAGWASGTSRAAKWDHADSVPIHSGQLVWCHRVRKEAQ